MSAMICFQLNSLKSIFPFSFTVFSNIFSIFFSLSRDAIGLNDLLIAIKLLCLVNRFVEIYNIAILIQYLFVAIVYFIMEVITATFPAIILITNFIIPFGIVGAILLCFIQ